MINDIKRSNVVRITQIKNNQIILCMSMKGLENIQATTGTWMKNLEHNKANISTCMKNMEPNQVNLRASLKNVETQMGQIVTPQKYPRIFIIT